MDIFEWTEQTAVSPNNLNKMQNILNGNIPNEIKNQSKIICANDDPTTIFPSQTITLNESLSGYDFYEILFRQSNTANRIMTSGKIPVGYGTILSWNTAINIYRPTAAIVSGNTITFEDAKTTNGVDNNTTIPLYVIGHKTGLFQ